MNSIFFFVLLKIYYQNVDISIPLETIENTKNNLFPIFFPYIQHVDL